VVLPETIPPDSGDRILIVGLSVSGTLLTVTEISAVAELPAVFLPTAVRV